jgi:hypothetical protein
MYHQYPSRPSGHRGCVLSPSPLTSLRASTTANSRMYAVTDRPAARDRRTSCSTSRTMLSAFAMGSCRQNSSSVAMMTPTHATDTRRAQVHTHRANQSNAFPVGIGVPQAARAASPSVALGTISEASVWGWELVASRAVPSHCYRMRVFNLDLIRAGHYGQRSCEPHLKDEHMAAPTNAANLKKALANSEPSTHGTSLTSRDVRLESAKRATAASAPAQV